MSFLSGAAKNSFAPASAYAPGVQATTQNLQPAIGAANEQYTRSQAGFNNLSDALYQQMNGGGPNLANQNLQNFTNQNVANQAALMGGQRGASSNVGLMARQIANQGANIQQNAAGQAASNVLAQQLAAQQQLGGVLSAQAGAANQNLGIQQGALQAQNQGILQNTQGMNTINANVAQQNNETNKGMLGGIGGTLATLGGTALGGPIGGAVAGQLVKPNSAGGGTGGGIFAAEGGQIPQQPVQQPQQPVIPQFLMNFAQGIRPNQVAMAQGGMAHSPMSPHDYRHGGNVVASNPQEKATVAGNSYSNDKIPAMVSEGEVVLDRDTMADKGPIGQMARALQQHIEAKKRGNK